VRFDSKLNDILGFFCFIKWVCRFTVTLFNHISDDI